MDTQRVLLAVLSSFAILMGYQYFFVPPVPVQERGGEVVSKETVQAEKENGSAADKLSGPMVPPAISMPDGNATVKGTLPLPGQYKEISVETDRYKAVVSEAGGGIKSFALKEYRETIKEGSAFKELIKTDSVRELPLAFSWGVEPAKADVQLYKADKDRVAVATGQAPQNLSLSSRLPSGLELIRTYTFNGGDYPIDLTVEVKNNSDKPVQGAPYLAMTNLPFADEKASQNSFLGPALYYNDMLKELKPDEIGPSGVSFVGKVGWIVYEDTYFMTAIQPGNERNPAESTQHTAFFSQQEKTKVHSVLAGSTDTIEPGGKVSYAYTVYFGPKKLTELKAAGRKLEKVIDFGWWDFIAKPTLFCLNFLYKYLHNYGVAIILITVLFKALFWPISQKGMESMKTMQKLQPKMAKLKEKYADDKERLNQEMMQLYKTYKVNPLGGCLPMVLQIPVFFALYKVLLQTIELRHAPFLLWINDLSAPDRLFIGIDLPYLGGLPILTLLMGGSMYLQQKMSPAPTDEAQAKMMTFLPIIFTFMFVNFASGLVLYWFVNNLLSIAQQYLINKKVAA